MTVLVTGGAGFIGANYIFYHLRQHPEDRVICLDELTYAGNPATLDPIRGDARFRFVKASICDREAVDRLFAEERPEIVFHLAAQPIVRLSYKEPRLTFETNVMGTVNLMECVRNTSSVWSVLNVTTDKVYKNDDLDIAFTEDMPLDGFDPYSNSKSCSELVTHSYVKSFFSEKDAPRISTARAGNVIGGGDFAPDRLIPDCVRAAGILVPQGLSSM